MSKKTNNKSEQRRTAVLLVLLAIAVGFIYYVQNNVNSNFESQFEGESTSLEG